MLTWLHLIPVFCQVIRSSVIDKASAATAAAAAVQGHDY